MSNIKEVISFLRDFVKQALGTNNLKYGEYKLDIKRFEIKTKASFGQGTKASVCWFSFLKKGQKTSQGYYPVYLIRYRE